MLPVPRSRSCPTGRSRREPRTPSFLPQVLVFSLRMSFLSVQFEFRCCHSFPLCPRPRFPSRGRSPECSYSGDNIYQACCEIVMEESLGKMSMPLLSQVFLTGIRNEALSLVSLGVSRHRFQLFHPSSLPKVLTCLNFQLLCPEQWIWATGKRRACEWRGGSVFVESLWRTVDPHWFQGGKPCLVEFPNRRHIHCNNKRPLHS